MTAWLATPRPDEGAVSWNINTTCNYRCSYCTQRFKEDRGRWSRDTPRFLAAFARLPGPWEIKISGGEPFIHPTLLEIVSGLAAQRHRVSIVTNFSASREKLEAFAEAAGGRVGIFSCSLHLEYVDSFESIEAFAEKAAWLERLLQGRADPSLPAPSVCVTTVATASALDRLNDLSRRFTVAFKVQPEKQPNGRAATYDERGRRVLLSFGGHNATGEIEHELAGRPCWAGARYFVLDELGVAWRCYGARRAKRERLGDFLDASFRLAEAPMPCLYDVCNCTVPIARRMMPLT
jgi:organic radical activating enzyme